MPKIGHEMAVWHTAVLIRKDSDEQPCGSDEQPCGSDEQSCGSCKLALKNIYIYIYIQHH